MQAGRRHKALATALVVALVFAGVGSTVAVEQGADTVVTGHTELVTMDTGASSCFAGIAGLLMQKVTWFNGQPLFSQPTGSGKWVYFTEHFDPAGTTGPNDYDEETGIRIKDPSEEQLFRTDNTYKFNVPGESKEWEVREYFALREQNPLQGGAEGQSGVKRVYVFAVQVSSNQFRADSLDGAKYNFVGLVDTCRFHGAGNQVSSPDDTSDIVDGQHNTSDPDAHPHGAFGVDIWIGDAPDTVPLTNETGVPDDRDNSSSAAGDAEDGEP